MNELRRLLPYLKRYKLRFILGFVFVTISNICSTYMPRVVGSTIDIIRTRNFAFSNITDAIITILALTAGSGIFMYFTRRAIIDASRLIEYDLRKDFFTTIEKQSMSFFQEHPTGSLMALATNDIPAAREFLGPAIMYTANTVTTFSFALFFMLRLNVSITLIALLPLPLIAFLTYRIGKVIHVTFRNVQEQFSNLTTQAQEAFSGIRVVRSFVREKYESEKFAEQSRSYLFKNMKLARIQAAMMPFLMILVGFSQVLALGYGGLQVINGHATLGDITQFFIYINLLIWPIAAIGWITNLIQRASASAGRLGKIFDIKPEITNSIITDYKIKEIRGSVELKDVSFNYGNGMTDALSDISLNIPVGSSLGIIGTVGSGKSTFIQLIPRMYDATSGMILIDGYNIKEIPLNILRNSVGVIPQEPFLFSMTIAENIRFGKPDATIAEIIEICKIARLHNDIMEFPEKYETILGERGITLSGGQKQRLAIARALLKNPSILILDDALSAVDTQTEAQILEGLHEFMKGRTTIIISHRISTVKNSDNIITLENGKIIESGTHDELLLLSGRYSEINSRQQLEQEIEMM